MQGVELRTESAAEVREARGSPENNGGVDAAEEGDGVWAGPDANRGEEKRREEARMAVAAAGDEECVCLQELARGGDACEERVRGCTR
jgi:hypothetical protein